MNDQHEHQIESYLAGNLSGDELRQFEKTLAENVELRAEVELARQINLHFSGSTDVSDLPKNEYTQKLSAFLKSDEASVLKSKLRKVADENKTSSTEQKRPRIYLIAAVLTVLVITTLGILFLGPDSSQQLYASYYSTEDLPSVISRDSENDVLQLGAEAFQENDFNASLKYFDQYFQTSDEILPSVHIYSGMAYSELGDYKNALVEFDKLINSDALDRSKGLWFKALVQLKMDDRPSAKRTLEELVNSPENFNYTEANELLSEL